MSHNSKEHLNTKINLVKTSAQVANEVSKQEAAESLKMEETANCLFPVPTSILESAEKVKNAIERYIIETDYKPSRLEDLVEYTDGEVSIEDIENYRQYGVPYLSLDSKAWEFCIEEETLDTEISNGDEERTEFLDSIYESLNQLNKYERNLLMERFGLSEYDEHDLTELSHIHRKTVEEIGDDLNVALSHFKTAFLTME